MHNIPEKPQLNLLMLTGCRMSLLKTSGLQSIHSSQNTSYKLTFVSSRDCYLFVGTNHYNYCMFCNCCFDVGQTILMETDPELDLKVMELELHKCSEKSRDAYQAQMACAMKLKHEVISLRALVSSQQDLITSLTQEFQTLRTERFQVGE